MSDIFKPEKTIWKMADGTFFEGALAELPKSGASKLAPAGKEISKAWLKDQGWNDKKAPAKKAPAKKAPAKKAEPKEKVETKAVKPSEDK